MEKEEFKKRYPHLAEEIEKGVGKADIVLAFENPKAKRKWAGYEPTVVDFIRRCNKKEEALEIIEYMRGRKEILPDEAERLIKQLEEKGLRSFGDRKTPGYYEREG